MFWTGVIVGVIWAYGALLLALALGRLFRMLGSPKPRR